MAAQLSSTQKELIMLWTLLSANGKYNPANNTMTSQQWIDSVANDYNTAKGAGSAWNWDNLTPATALATVDTAIGKSDSFSAVNQSFAATTATLPQDDPNFWDPDLPDHPNVHELATALAL